jgi:predicted Zn-dependent protease
MIGKRKINNGSDKFFGWLGGSKEKEMAIGRQLALEVEQQAKLVEDPIITEYINRVGQNVVLHSDAKIPFTIKVIDSDEVNAFALPGGFFTSIKA